jgi:uncharacterized membrane-anchored protein
MVEYGNGISQGAGQAGGGHAVGRTVDVGTSVGQFVTDSVHTVSTMPPAMLFAGVVAIIVGLFLLKRAF